MKKKCIRYSIFLLVLISMLMGCATPKMTAFHSTDELYKLALTKDSFSYSFYDDVIVLRYIGDSTLAPIGCNIDEYSEKNVNYVNKTFVIPKPGYVLFDKIARELGKHDAKVYRQYTDNPLNTSQDNNTSLLSLTFDHIEYHLVRIKEDMQIFYLGKAVISYDYQRYDQALTGTIVVRSKVLPEEDVFSVIANQFLQKLNQEI